jgi:tetratricopeptide (TPR) repeat protein
MTELAKAALRRGHGDHADRLLDDATTAALEDDEHMQAACVVPLLGEIARVGGPDRARTLLQPLRELTESQLGARPRLDAMTALGQATAAAGDQAAATDLAGTIEAAARRFDYSEQSDTLPKMAEALARCGHYGMAEKLAWSTNDPVSITEGVTHATIALAAAGKDKRARSVFGGIDYMQHEALVVVVAALAGSGALAPAFAFAHVTDHPPTRAEALAVVAKAAVAAGDHDSATGALDELLDMLELLSGDLDRHARTDTLIKIAPLAAVLKGHAQGAALANRITTASDKAVALAGLATAAVDAGDTDIAGQLLDEALILIRPEGPLIPSPPEPMIDVGAAAFILGRAPIANELFKAAESAATAHRTHRRSTILHKLTLAVAATGAVDEAARIARSMTYHQADRLTALVDYLAAADNYSAAEAITESIAPADHRAAALAALARANILAGDTPRARSLIARALTNATWPDALPVLAEIEPHIIPALANHYMTRLSSRRAVR